MKHLPQISEAEYEVMKIVWAYAPISTNEITDYSGPAAHLGRSLAQLDRASAHLIQSAFRHMPIADQPIY